MQGDEQISKKNTNDSDVFNPKKKHKKIASFISLNSKFKSKFKIKIKDRNK